MGSLLHTGTGLDVLAAVPGNVLKLIMITIIIIRSWPFIRAMYPYDKHNNHGCDDN